MASVGRRTGVGGARARTRCKPSLLLCSVTVTALLEGGWGQRDWSKDP